MTKGYANLRERLKARPILYVTRDGRYDLVGVFCSRCAPDIKAQGLKAKKLTAREVWNYNWKSLGQAA